MHAKQHTKRCIERALRQTSVTIALVEVEDAGVISSKAGTTIGISSVVVTGLGVGVGAAGVGVVGIGVVEVGEVLGISGGVVVWVVVVGSVVSSV